MHLILSSYVTIVLIFTCFIISIELSYGPSEVNESIFVSNAAFIAIYDIFLTQTFTSNPNFSHKLKVIFSIEFLISSSICLIFSEQIFC